MRIFLTYTIFLLPFLVSQFANFGAVCGDVLMEKAQKDFAINLLRAATDENGMKACVMSPISVGIALAMTLIGAGGQTEKQMMDVLAKGATKEDAIEYLSRQYNKMIGTNEKYELISADKLLIQKNFNPLPAFTETITSKFGPQLETINFNEARKAAERINEWVANKTNDKLHDLVSPVIFNVLTRLVLLNAIYFKGKWVNTFISEATTPATFYEAKNKERQVDMMSTKGSFGLGHVDGVTVLTMPYSGDDIVMVVFLPDEKYGLANFEKDLTGERFSSLVNSSWTQSVEVKLPKFKIETRVDLNGPLKKLGIVDAFDNKANFSGMSEEPLRISKVVHKAFIEVNEEGTEAAAATGVVVMTRMMVHTQQFTADHPFLFAILRQRSVLFIGRYV